MALQVGYWGKQCSREEWSRPVRLCHKCACAQRLWLSLGRAPREEMNLLCHLTSTFWPLGGMHGIGGGEAIPTVGRAGHRNPGVGHRNPAQHLPDLHPLAPTASTGKIPLNTERSCRASLSMGNHVNLLTRHVQGYFLLLPRVCCCYSSRVS